MSLLINSADDIQNQPEARAYAGPLPEGASIFEGEAPKAESRDTHEQPTPEQFTPDLHTSRLRAALEVAQADNLDAARVARGISIARNLGLPQSVVMADLEYARREEVARKIEANPLLANWAAKNEFNAAVAAGDADTLNALFSSVQAEHQKFQTTRPDMGLGERFLTLLGEGTRDVAQGLDGFLVAAARSLSHGTLRDAEGNDLGDYEHTGIAAWADYRQQQIADIEQATGPRLEAQTVLGGYLQDVVRMIPQLGGQIAASVAGGPLAGMAFMGGQIAGSQYEDLMRNGVDDDRAFAAGLANAAMQAPLEQLGLGRLAAIFKTTGLKNIAKRTAEGVFTEGATEFLQSFPESATDIWAKLAQDEGAAEWYSRFMAALPETARQGLYEAAVAAPFGLLGGLGKAAHDRARQKQAEAFSAGQIAIHENVEAARTKGAAPEMVESALNAAGMDQIVGVDAEALQTLHQDGRDLLTPLGLSEEDVATAAGAGQDIHLPLARLHSRLNQEEITTIMPHVRQTPDALTGAQAAHVNEKIAADALKVAELFQGDAQLFEDMKAERERLHEEAVNAIREHSGLVAQAEASSGSVEAYVDDWLNMAQAFAYRMGASGQNPVEFMRKLTMSEVRAMRRARMSREELIAEDLGTPGPAPFDASPDSFLGGMAASVDARGQAAMYRSPAENIGVFVEQVRGEAPRSKKSAFVFGNAERPEAGLSGAALELTSDAVRHIDKRHPGFAGWGALEAIVNQGDCYAIKPDTKTKNPGRAFSLVDGDNVQAILGYVKNGKKGARFIIETAFEGTQKGFAHWLKQKQATPIYQSAGGSPAQPKPTGGRISELERNGLTEKSVAADALQSNAAETNHRKITGAETQILGKGTSEPARYEVWELADVIPSHDPANGFARREDYPASAQERPYHSDTGEQEKVRGNALAYQPDFVLNTDPTAGNGPPIITRDGIVLGGNSRTMTLQLVYADNAQGADAYRAQLAERAAQFGLDADAVASLREPILVRVVEGDMAADDMAVKSRQYNQTTTQKLQAKAEGVSRARLLSAETLAELSADMADFDTLRQFFDSPKSRGFVQSLLRDGVLEQTEISSLTDKNGRLNESGKSLVENALRGLVVPDYDILAATPPAVLNKLDRIIPALAKLMARGEGWDLTGVVIPALRIVGAAAKENRKLEGWLGQVDLLDTDPDKKRPAVQALALTLANATQKEVLARFEAFASASERQQKGMGLLMARHEAAKPAPAFIKAFMQPLASVDGKTLTDFDPTGNPRHAALLWAYEHGGKGRTVAAAMANLEKTMNAKKVPAEKKAEAREMMRELADFSGAVAIYEPRLGPYFQYREGQQLFQTGPAQGSAAFKSWFGKSKVVDENGEPLTVFHGTGATVGEDFGFDYRFSGKNGSADGYGFYFTSDENTAKDYQENGGSIVKAYLSLQKPMPVKQKPFSKAVLKKILKNAVEREIEQFPDDTPDYRDSFLSNYADTYEMSFDRALNEAVEMIYEAETALEQISEIANASGNKRATVEAVRAVTGYDSVFANGYGDKGAEGGKIYVAWFPEQVKSVENRGSWNSADPRIFFQSKDTKVYPNNGKAVGDVTPEVAATLQLNKPGPIVLDEVGLAHIEERHGKEIREKGFDSIESFISYALNNFDSVYKGNRENSYQLVLRSKSLYPRIIITLQLKCSGNFYRINTAHFIRADTYKNKTPLWERAQSSHSEEPLALVSGQSGVNEKITTGRSGVNHKTLHSGDAEGAGYRGSTRIYPESYLISLFKGADLSTLLHETGHVFFEEMERMVESCAADETLVRDYATMRDWLGATAGEPLTVAQREQAARGFEAYLMEGKAPSENLASAFGRFRRWLLKIYQSAVRLNAPLTDEVRGVFDRMISTEREIAATAARNELLDLTARELDALGLTGQTRETAAGLMSRGREAAAEALEQARAENRDARMKKYLREAREEVREMQVYAARRALRQTPLDLDSVREGYGEDTARALLKTLPGSARKEGGMDPEIFAAEHGYENAAAMFRDVLNARRQGNMVAEVVRQKEAKHDQAYDAFEYLLETKEVAIQMELVGRKLSELLGVRSVESEAYQRAAQQELAAMPLGRAVQTGNFLAAMRRALQQMRTALAAGDREKALIAQRKAALNMEFARQSRQIAKSRDKLERGIKRFVSMKKADPDARYMVMDMGQRYGFCKPNERLAEGRDADTTRKWLAAADAAGETIFPDEAVLYGPGKPWRAMSVTEFEDFTDTVAQIITLERNRRKLLTAQGKEDLDEVVEDIAASIHAHRQSHAVKTVESQPAGVRALKGLHAIHTKVEALCLAVDGDKMGPAWEYIYRPITEADDRQALRFRTVKEDLNAPTLFGAYSKKELAQMGTRRELVPEIGERLTWENRIAVALNMGNAVNVERIKSGHGWNDEQIAAVLKPLTARDWNFVQAVWNYLDTFKEESFQLEEEMSGLRPKAVEAQPLTVHTADGQTLHLAGGYYPIKYNPEKGDRAFAQNQKEADKALFGGRNYGAAMTRAGHLKERDAHGLGTPILLELSVVTDHVFNVVHDLCFRKAVLDVAKIIRQPKVREAFENTVGADMYRQLLPWLQDVAGERQEPMHQIHRWARWARASTSIMQMGFKITTMLAQPMGITQSVELLGYRWTAVGVKQVYRNYTPSRWRQMLQETYARSPFMANRMQSFDREVRDITKQLQPSMGRFGWLQVLKDKAFVPMGMVQMGVDLPTWWGAYAKGVQDFAGDEAKAAQYADSIVRMSQGSGSTKDLARVQRGSELMRLFTMFYSYFNTFYQLGARRIASLRDHHSPADIFRAANTALLLWFMPAVFGELLAGRGPDADDDEWKWASMQILQYPFQTVVGVRDLASGIFGEFGYQITPAQSAPAAMVKWFKSVNKALEKEDPGLLAKPTAEALGYAFSLPMKQPIITVGNLWNYLTGEDPDFAVRDLFFTKKKKDRK